VLALGSYFPKSLHVIFAIIQYAMIVQSKSNIASSLKTVEFVKTAKMIKYSH